MGFERPTGAGPGIGAEPAPTPGPAESTTAPAPGDVTPAMRLQILSTEHWSLLASRSLAWNESFARAGMFLSTLSGAIVALALVAQATQFGEGFRIFALVILPVVLFVGVGTVLRMGIANYHDAVCVMGMNRIRAAYLEAAPDLSRYFVMGTTDDERGILATMAIAPRTSMLAQMVASSPMLISVVNGVLAGAIVSLAAIQVNASTVVSLVAGALAFVFTVAAFGAYARREIARGSATFVSRFPSEPVVASGPSETDAA
ncbi:MAG: hypothetical protein K5924_12305 [Chloroflexi bacterium]|nr:hypothetical protein [Chloroflexota bacterium]